MNCFSEIKLWFDIFERNKNGVKDAHNILVKLTAASIISKYSRVDKCLVKLTRSIFKLNFTFHLLFNVSLSSFLTVMQVN